MTALTTLGAYGPGVTKCHGLHAYVWNISLDIIDEILILKQTNSQKIYHKRFKAKIFQFKLKTFGKMIA